MLYLFRNSRLHSHLELIPRRRILGLCSRKLQWEKTVISFSVVMLTHAHWQLVACVSNG